MLNLHLVDTLNLILRVQMFLDFELADTHLIKRVVDAFLIKVWKPL